ncbi:recombinase family protein [Streptomyces virginiae]|uniref:recombinase family protein n=1 Tax=Streptomyces TaxID=1883 RepID=UPI002E290E26|nr:recombinase family protein [Streptomyces sp. NBC_00239]WSX96970.1 recombinase family protein [Streptomyces goshikiensis]
MPPEDFPRRSVAADAILGTRLETLLGWLLALPSSPATAVLIEEAERPSFTDSAGLRGLVARAEEHVKERATAAVYAVVPPGAGERAFADMETAAARYCTAKPLRHHDLAPLAGHERPGLRAVLELVEDRSVQILVVPSLDHLPPDGTGAEDSLWTLTGIRALLSARGVRLIAADHRRTLSGRMVGAAR